MRQRERIVRIAASAAEELGLDAKDKSVIETIVSNVDKDISKIFSKREEKKNNDKKGPPVEEVQQELTQKKKNPFPPKKKKVSESSEEEATAPIDE